jgi:phosphatidylserine decarboxylase
VNIPVFWREPIYGAYVNTFGCRMDEAAEENLRTYPTFAAFFNRALKEGIRPISNSILVGVIKLK